ncbi:MAG: glycosyltransferase family 4 protein [Candidatus Nanoarchaeia archaeon]
MQIAIIGGKRTQPFNLAFSLEKKGLLHSVITCEFFAKKHVKKRYIKKMWGMFPFMFIEKLNLLFPFLGFIRHFTKQRENWMYNFLLEKRIKKLKNVDVIIAWPGLNRNVIKAAHKKNIKIVFYYGSAHPDFKKKLFEDEYSRAGLQKKVAGTENNKIKEKMEAHYNADLVFVGSQRVKEQFIQKGFFGKSIKVVPYSTNISFFYPAGKKDEKFRILFCGRLILRKGVHYLIQAFYELDLPDSELVLLGSLSEEMKYYLDKYKSNKIKTHGAVLHSKINKYYNLADVYVQPSLSEGLSLTVLEALSSGLPVIASENTGAGDIVENGKEGFIVPIRDVDAIKEKLKFLYENPMKRKKMAENARKLAERYDMSNYADRVLEALNGLVENKKY